ncbi:alpha/beta fold hydrolase [Parachryseolinea silvisoli]|uniref:alpha/beta fold hydrolase n=1 Tax=Parachryseolinea silvisoli TaxID=2873601 RepID=UPI002265C67B|nr:alpha/beta hydrolase [Parachryseolinea silvisoli]MCD9015765.1 alpha/beta hydrolase [Parachryseolinea silvisoli]
MKNTNSPGGWAGSLMLCLLACSLQHCSTNTSESKPQSAEVVGDSIVHAATVATQYVEKDGRRIAYRKIGQGPAMILCNRFRGTLDDWDPLFLDQLAQHYTVVTFDYSGIGLSTLVNPADSLTEVRDVRDLAQALNIQQCVLVGWSHGGRVAQYITAHTPQLVSHLILLGTGPLGKNAFAPEQIFFDRALKPVNDEDDEVVLFFEPRYKASVEAARQSRARIQARTVDRDIYVTPDKFEKYFQTVARYGADEKAHAFLATAGIPILALSGEHDIVFPIEGWYALTRHYTSLQIIMLPQAGHGPQQQYPALTASYLHNFITHTAKTVE